MRISLFSLQNQGKKKNRKMQELHKSVKSGDKVITVSGLYGTVKEKVGEDVLLVIDEDNDVTVKVVIYAIQSIITASGSKE